MSADLGYSDKLSPQHQGMLRDSGITPEVASQRGYWTADAPGELEKLGFAKTQCLTPSLVIPIHNAAGVIKTHQIRPDNPRTNEAGDIIKYETPAGSTLVVDCPPATRPLLKKQDVPLYVTEGARKADAAVSKGLCCVALQGVWGFKGRSADGGKSILSDWDEIVLNGRDVYIVFDSDVMEKASVAEALKALKKILEARNAIVKTVYLPPKENRSKQGLDDFLAAGGSIADLEQLATTEVQEPRRDASSATSPEESGKDSQIKRIMKFIKKQEIELFHSPNRTAYATFENNGHQETCSVASPEFGHWLRARFLREKNEVVSNSSMENIIPTLEALANYDGKELPVSVRVAAHEDDFYIDLVNPSWEVLRITKDGYSVESVSPVKFLRTANMAPLPHPVDGKVDLLRPLVNIAGQEDFHLLIAWIVAALSPITQYPILVLYGGQGSAKSTLAKVVRMIVDPVYHGDGRGVPKDVRDLAVASSSAHSLFLTNVSALPHDISDALCRTATGEGYATRKLYTDNEEMIFDRAVPICMNGIVDFVHQQDLLDRSIVLRLPPIDETKRREETGIFTTLEERRAGILGACAKALVNALRYRESVKLTKTPRMAEFAKLICSAESGLGWKPGTFIKAYSKNVDNAVTSSLETSTLASVLISWFNTRTDPWEGILSKLLQELNTCATDEIKRQPGWPKQPNTLSHSLKRLAPALKRIGIVVNALPHQRAGTPWRIERSDDAAPPSDDQGGISDDCVTMENPSSQVKNPLSPQGNIAAQSKDDGGDDGPPSIGPSSLSKKITREEEMKSTGVPLAISDQGSSSPSPSSLESLDEWQSLLGVHFDFTQTPGQAPEPRCLHIRNLRDGTEKGWLRSDMGHRAPYPFLGLLVTFDATRMIGCEAALNWISPDNLIDLKVEFRNQTNGEVDPEKVSLLSALAYYGINDPCVQVLESTQRKPTLSDDETLAVGSASVKAIDLLFRRMLPEIHLTQAWKRGRELVALALVESRGVPIDQELLNKVENNFERIRDMLTAKLDASTGVYEGGKLKRDKLKALADRLSIDWPKHESGELRISNDAFSEMASKYSVLRPLATLKEVLGKLTPSKLPVGTDGRNRTPIKPFQANTGRNQPSSTGFILNRSKWWRGFIKPEPGKALINCDYQTQEVQIAAVLSGDEALKQAYQADDLYVEFGKQAGAIPADGTKESNPKERALYKTAMLGLQYGQGSSGLAEETGLSGAQAKELLWSYRRTYSDLRKWSNEMVERGQRGESLQTKTGWRFRDPQAKENTLRNFLVQATGADILREAIVRAQERGLTVIAPLHDSLLFEVDEKDIENAQKAILAVMREASATHLDGFELRCDLQVIRYPDRFDVGDQKDLWDSIMRILDSVESEDEPSRKVG